MSGPQILPPATDSHVEDPPSAGAPAPVDDGPQPLASIRRDLPEDWDDQVDLFAIVKLDGGGVVRGWNLGAQRIKGYTEEEVLGTHFSRFYREEDRLRGVPDALLAAAQRDGHVEDTGWRVRRDGREFWARVTISTIRSDEGQVLGFVKIVRDLTAEKRVAGERAALERTFAHDLMSPVTALRGYIDMLADDLPQGHRVLQLASDASDHLVAMAEVLTRYATARPQRDHARATLDLIARGAVAIVLPGEGPGRISFGRMDPVPVRGDVLDLRRAVANVVENAAKYSDDVIEVQVFETDEGAVVSVRDRGRGIHPDDVRIVTQEGYRGRDAEDRAGRGIGLASVRRIVEEHGGTLKICSDVGVGTTVTIVLPRDDDAEIIPARS